MSLFKLNMGGAEVLFVHIPKTGGTSIRKDCQVEDGLQYNPKSEWQQLPSFAFVRNPFDRIASCWRDFRFARKMTLLDFNSFVIWFNRTGIGERIDDPKSIEHHVASMVHPVHGLSYAQHIYRYENLQSSYDEFRRSLGLNKLQLPIERSTSKFSGPPKTNKNVALIERYYHDDYELWESTK